MSIIGKQVNSPIRHRIENIVANQNFSLQLFYQRLNSETSFLNNFLIQKETATKSSRRPLTKFIEKGNMLKIIWRGRRGAGLDGLLKTSQKLGFLGLKMVEGLEVVEKTMTSNKIVNKPVAHYLQVKQVSTVKNPRG